MFDKLFTHLGREFSEIDLQPEEEKDWPLYIKQRFEVFSHLQRGNFDGVLQIVRENPDLANFSLLYLIGRRIGEEREKRNVNVPVPLELINQFSYLFYDVDDSRRLESIKILSLMGDVGLPILVSLKKDQNPIIRREVARSVSRMRITEDNLLGLLKEMSQDDDFNVRAEVARTLSQCGPVATEILIAMQNDENPSVRKMVAASLGEMGRDSVKALEAMKSDNDTDVRINVAVSLHRVGESQMAIDLLNEILESEEGKRYLLSIVEALGQIGRPALNILNKIAETKIEGGASFNYEMAQLEVAKGLLQMGEKEKALTILRSLGKTYFLKEMVPLLAEMGNESLEILIPVSNHPSWIMRTFVAKALSYIGPAGKELLLTMRNDSNDDVRLEVACSLLSIGERDLAFEILKNLEKSPDPSIQVKAGVILLRDSLTPEKKNNLIRALILRQEPFFANPMIMEIIKEGRPNPIVSVMRIVNRLKDKYPSLVGVIVFGSLAKGYWVEGADMDGMMIVEGEAPPALLYEFSDECLDAQVRLCESFKLFVEARVSSYALLDLANIFCGFFIGDRQKLRRVQKKVFGSFDEEGWETMRRTFQEEQNNYQKIIERFGLSPEEVEFITQARNFLWGLPTYETAKKIFSQSEER